MTKIHYPFLSPDILLDNFELPLAIHLTEDRKNAKVREKNKDDNSCSKVYQTLAKSRTIRYLKWGGSIRKFTSKRIYYLYTPVGVNGIIQSDIKTELYNQPER